MSTTAHVEPSSVSVAPGDEQRVELRVRNSGDIVESYRLTVVGQSAQWAAVEPGTLSLYPGTEGTAVVAFRPPRSAEVHAGVLPYAVRVLPAERPDAVVVPEGSVEVLPFHELDAEVLPHQRKRRLRARFQLRVANLGNAPLTLALALEETTEDVGHTLSAETLTLQPGEETFLDLVVRARRPVWFGRPVEHPFAVRLRREGDENPAVPSGTFIQQPLLPAWLLALLALLLVLVALWFALVLPTVRSAAREQADAAVEEASNASALPSAPPADGAAPGATGGGGGEPGGADGSGGTDGGQADGGAPGGPGGAQGPGGTRGSGGTGGAPGTSQEFATVLEASVAPGQSEAAVFRVPDDQLLLITDIVANAPQGDTGTLRVSINDRTVTSLALENFRNHDNHWVTPVEAPPGSSIVLSVTCRRPGSPPDAPAPTACDTSLFVNGLTVNVAGASPSGTPR
ncbi:hydrolytic protein [Streptomyces sp. TRM 70351]|uniref:COG1470 family protein n=1 Tax=Streptomyces sp. TRM 70351 TaxID=3116552 RepID=UPI002E7ADB27|nr:hydrolytic protein [Streptomyces sp. TRM 70351]MEE1927557.1 hydrolytic protein [Streptomyces sp. TRM 70351]